MLDQNWQFRFEILKRVITNLFQLIHNKIDFFKKGKYNKKKLKTFSERESKNVIFALKQTIKETRGPANYWLSWFW